jgi:hypothetical protein
MKTNTSWKSGSGSATKEFPSISWKANTVEATRVYRLQPNYGILFQESKLWIYFLMKCEFILNVSRTPFFPLDFRQNMCGLYTRKHGTLLSGRSIQYIPLHPSSRTSILILSFHLCLCPPSCLFPPGFSTKFLHACIFPPIHVSYRAHVILLELIVLITTGQEIKLPLAPCSHISSVYILPFISETKISRHTECPQIITLISTGCNILTMKLTQQIFLQVNLNTHKVFTLVSPVYYFCHQERCWWFSLKMASVQENPNVFCG